MFRYANAVGDAERFMTAENGCAAVALALGIVPERLIARKLQVELARTEFYFLQTEKVGVEVGEYIGKTFAAGR